MRLPLAIAATLFLTATTALPAFAASPAPSSVSLRDAAAAPIEAVQHRQTTRRTYRNGYRAFGQYYYGSRDPYPQRVYPNAWSGSWGHCVGGLGSGAESAFPSWDTCSGR